MKTLKGLEGLLSLPHGAIVSVGNYDGVHVGHLRLLSICRELKAASPASLIAVVTFEPHPLTVLFPQGAPPRLTTHQQKQRLLTALGVDYLVELPPDKSVLNLSAEDFWNILHDRLQVAHLVEGDDFNFGKGRGGNIARLREWASQSSLQLHVADEVSVVLTTLQVVEVRSSLIRWLVAQGRARDAAICLSRPYAFEGLIVKGYQRGRTIGFPTANFDCGDQLLPADGVYAGRCEVDGHLFPAAVSIGTLPTFGECKRQVEAYLVGFEGDLYGRTLSVDVLDWIREQVKYHSVQALKTKLYSDVTETLFRQQSDSARPILCIA